MSTATTHIQTEKQLVPALRFKEFDGEFSLSKLGDELNLFNGYAFSSKDSSENGVRWVKIADVGINKMKLDTPSFLPSEFKEKHSKFLLNKGDYVVALTRPILGGKLKIARINNDFDGSLLNQRVGKLESKNDLEYMYCMLQQKSLISRIENRIAGTDPPNLSPNEIATLKTHIPSLPEQQKIASFLSAVDEKIQQLTKKKALLEQYKKGVMQQLFSGQLRFKDQNGNPYPDWEENKLSEVLDLFHGYQFRSTDFVSSGLAIIKISNVIGSQLNLEGVSFIDDKRYEEFERFEIKKGDILMSLTGNIGRVIEVGELPFKVIQNYRVGKFIPFDLECLSREFTKYLLMSDDVFGRFGQLSNQSAQANFGKQDMDKIHVTIPNIAEQRKIATYLSSIDTKIEAVNNQITQTQTFKKGLLQQMFVAA